MPRAFFISLFLLGAAGLASADPVSALTALKSIPKEALPQIALIEGIGGKPNPDRWHILAQDPTDPTGVHEYVVAGGKVIASRSLSQFAEELKPSDVVGIDEIKIDSLQAWQIADHFAGINQIKPRAYNYELKRAPDGPVGLWVVTVVGEGGESVGKVVLTAAKGVVVSHEGFSIEPGSPVPLASVSERPKTDPAKKPPRAVPVETPIPQKAGFLQKVGRLFGGAH